MPSTDAYLNLASGRSRGPLAAAARAGLSLAAIPYRLGVAARNAAFDHRWKRIHRVERPVISVGNITLGGTGKTPTVEWIARRLRQHNLRVAVISRGYKSTQGLNDEGLVLDQNLPDVPHLQDHDRVRLARIAIDELDAQVLVLDDGFQHRRLARDLDIVLLDALCPFGHRRLFPRGLLREPIQSLTRANIVILSRANLIDPAARAAIRAAAERRRPLAWAEAAHQPRDLVDHLGQSAPLASIGGLRIAAFCGIGNPHGFRKTLETTGVEPIAFRAFPDHHPYTRADVADLAQWVRDQGADLALTTQKDLVKLRVPNLGPAPLRALRIGLVFLSGQELVEQSLAQCTQNPRH